MFQQNSNAGVKNENFEPPIELESNTCSEENKSDEFIFKEESLKKVENESEKVRETVKSEHGQTITSLNSAGDNKDGTKKFKRGNKLSSSAKKKKLNHRLSKLLSPKNAFTFLNQLKPGCTYKINSVPRLNRFEFDCEVLCNGEILGTGQGLSKSQCKASAAANAVKTVVSKALAKKNFCNPQNIAGYASETEAEDLPWAGLASYALFKLFSDWESEKLIASPRTGTFSSEADGETSLEQPQSSCKPERKKELPQNASEMHPGSLLNEMIPGLTAVELHREMGSDPRFVMGYYIDGKMYTGEADNKKDAKKEAAKAVATDLWGISYE